MQSSFSPIPGPSHTSGPVFEKHKTLPVMGRAEGGKGNKVIEDTPIDWTFRPADLQNIHDAFAVYVTGSSMEPKYKPDDLAYIHPRKTPVRGRYVLIETVENQGLVKQFLKWEKDILLVRQFSPLMDIRIPRSEVKNVFLIIGSMDS